jgi:RNA recognition motif-containing protein
MWVRNNKGNIFVGNLPPDFSDEQLAETFDPYGIVLSAAVARDRATGARLRYGFVDIATERAATQAISALDGSEVGGCKLNVKARERKTGVARPGARPRRPALRSALPNGKSSDAAPSFAGPLADNEAAPARTRPAQSQLVRDAAPALEPPPRSDFEVVRRPVRRKVQTFQVERRSLPRRV